MGNDSIEVTYSYQKTKEEYEHTYYNEENLRFIITRKTDEQGSNFYVVDEGSWNVKSSNHSSYLVEESTGEYTFGPISSSRVYNESGYVQYGPPQGKLNSAYRTYKRGDYGWYDERNYWHEDWKWNTSTSELNPEEESFIYVTLEVIDPTKSQ